MGLYKDYQKDKKVRTVKQGDGPVLVELLRISDWKTPHANQCTVCNHARVAEIEHLYMDFVNPEVIREEFGISKQTLTQHSYATGLQLKRISNRKGIYERIVERALQSSATPSISEALNAMQHLDKLEGKVVDKKEITTKSVEEREKEFADILKLVPKKQ